MADQGYIQGYIQPDIHVTPFFKVLHGPDELSNLYFHPIYNYTINGGNSQVQNIETGYFADLNFPFNGSNGTGSDNYFYRFSFGNDYTPEWVRGPYKGPVPLGLQPGEKGSDLNFPRADHHDDVNAAALGIVDASAAHDPVRIQRVPFLPTLPVPPPAGAPAPAIAALVAPVIASQAFPAVAPAPVNVSHGPQYLGPPPAIGTQAHQVVTPAPVVGNYVPQGIGAPAFPSGTHQPPPGVATGAPAPAAVAVANPQAALSQAADASAGAARPPNANNVPVSLRPGFARNATDDFRQGWLDGWQPIHDSPPPDWLHPTNDKNWTAVEVLLLVYEERRGQHRGKDDGARPPARFREWGFTRGMNAIDKMRSNLNKNGWFRDDTLLGLAVEMVENGMHRDLVHRVPKKKLFNSARGLGYDGPYWEA
ncbi:hypothetical protein GE09DRAFT_1277697 [Coniochaeta sp. 2T2.1]|nr:hypothetical protein GE09DRAFT_1277697 [Coniochaeta sp. 2T2.1]